MAYIKTNWNTNSFINPTNMNHIEDGIYNVSDKVDNLSADDIPYDSNNSVKDQIDTNAYKLDLANITRVQVTKNVEDTDFYLIWRTDSNNAMQIRFNSSGIRMMKQTNGTWTEIWTK